MDLLIIIYKRIRKSLKEIDARMIMYMQSEALLKLNSTNLDEIRLTDATVKFTVYRILYSNCQRHKFILSALVAKSIFENY